MLRPVTALLALSIMVGCIAPRMSSDPFHVYVVNRSTSHVKAYVHPPLGRPYYVLGSVLPGETRVMDARCADFLARSTSFRLRTTGYETFLDGWGVMACTDSLVIYIPSGGPRLASVEVYP